VKGKIKMQKSKSRNILLSLLVLIIGLVIFTKPIFSQEKLDIEAQEGSEPAKVEYFLPYPGILPDHPLYKLKMLRDRIWGFFIRDPLKKSQWYLLMADKRIWASQMLVDKGKFALAVSTASKAEKYLLQAVDKAYQAREMGKGDKMFFQKMFQASLKHEEVLAEILKKTPDEFQLAIEESINYTNNASQKILELLSKD